MELFKAMTEYILQNGCLPGNEYWSKKFEDAINADEKAIQVQAVVKVNFAERIIEEEIEKLEKLANEYKEDMGTEGYINNLNDSNILHRVLIRIKSESKISA